MNSLKSVFTSTLSSIPHFPSLFTKKRLISSYLLGPLAHFAHLWLEMHRASQKYGEVTRKGNRGPGTSTPWRIERASSPPWGQGSPSFPATSPTSTIPVKAYIWSLVCLHLRISSAHSPPIVFPQRPALPLWGHVNPNECQHPLSPVTPGLLAFFHWLREPWGYSQYSANIHSNGAIGVGPPVWSI